MKKQVRFALNSAGVFSSRLVTEPFKRVPLATIKSVRPEEMARGRSRRVVTPDGRMRCLGCDEMKPVHEFYLHVRKGVDGAADEKHYDSRCDGCRKMAPKLKQFNLTADEYRALLARANGKCEICHEDLGKRPAVDHCHRTGKVRGVLCSRCNTGLGMFRESLDIFLMAITYLEKRGI